MSWWDGPVSVGHFRTATAAEVDLVLERDDGQVVAFEIKAGTRIHPEDLRGVRDLRTGSATASLRREGGTGDAFLQRLQRHALRLPPVPHR